MAVRIHDGRKVSSQPGKLDGPLEPKVMSMFPPTPEDCCSGPKLQGFGAHGVLLVLKPQVLAAKAGIIMLASTQVLTT